MVLGLFCLHRETYGFFYIEKSVDFVLHYCASRCGSGGGGGWSGAYHVGQIRDEDLPIVTPRDAVLGPVGAELDDRQAGGAMA